MTDSYSPNSTAPNSVTPAASAPTSTVPGSTPAPWPTDDIKAYQPPQVPQSSTPAWMPSTAATAPITPAQVVPQVAPAPVVSSSSPAPASATAPAAASTSAPETDSESLESQNIFALLGANDGTEADKEAFLDELQEVIWQDFLVNDLQLLLTREELEQVRALQAKTPDPVQQQTEIVVFLEKLIPDLEDIMLEKALELKRQMVQERMSGLREYFAGKPEQLAKVDAAQQLVKQNRWTQAAQALNALN